MGEAPGVLLRDVSNIPAQEQRQRRAVHNTCMRRYKRLSGRNRKRICKRTGSLVREDAIATSHHVLPQSLVHGPVGQQGPGPEGGCQLVVHVPTQLTGSAGTAPVPHLVIDTRVPTHPRHASHVMHVENTVEFESLRIRGIKDT
jgi:hypothetical protein